MTIVYQVNKKVSLEQFVFVLTDSTLAKRRPIDDASVMQAMLDNADLTVTAWQEEKLVGIARCVTDFAYCCYLSDLAVSEHLQHQGIGKKLIALVEEQLPKTCKLILLASPKASEYYGKIGFTQHPRAWVKS